MSRVIEFVKDHPLGVSITAGGLVLTYFYLSAGSSSAAQPAGTVTLGPNAADVQAASQFQVASIQANAAVQNSNNQAAVANNQISAQVIAAQLSSQDTLAGISATKDVTTNRDNLSAQTTQAVSLLQAQVAENQTNASVEQDRINANAYVTIASLPYTSVTPALIKNVAALDDYAAANQAFTQLTSTQVSNIQSHINGWNTPTYTAPSAPTGA
jgi:hypothetical protein